MHYYVCCLRFRAMCFYSSLDLTMSIGKDLFELIYFIKWISECCVLASQWFMLVSGVIYRNQVEDLASTYWSRNHRLVRLAKALKDLRVSVVVNLEWFPLVVDQGLEAYFRIPLDRQERESEWRQAWETFDRWLSFKLMNWMMNWMMNVNKYEVINCWTKVLIWGCSGLLLACSWA